MNDIGSKRCRDAVFVAYAYNILIVIMAAAMYSTAFQADIVHLITRASSFTADLAVVLEGSEGLT